MLNDTNNAAWLEAEILRVARIERTVEIEPAIQNLSRECKDRGYPQRVTDLRQLITDARRAEADDAAEAEAEATRESGVWRGRTVRVDTEDKEATAEQFLGAMFQHPKGWKLVFWRDVFYEWQTTHWTPTDTNELKHDLRLWLAEECFEATNKGFGPVKPTIRLVEEVMAALKALTLYQGANSTGWLTRTKPAAHPLSVKNGILDLGTRTLHPHTPTLFNLQYVDADCDQNAPDLMDTPAGPWLMEAFGVDQIPLLQEFTGYFLTGRTDAQKALMIIGPPRSGKGTYGRVLAALLGGNMASMSARTMGGQFGREGLLDKPVCIMPDMRVGKNTDKAAVAETLLSVIGEDWVEVPRKYKTPWHGKLDTRFLIMSNSVPWLEDFDGALYTRFHFIETLGSWLGKEDARLLDKIWSQPAAWLNWALDGMDRLGEQGMHFTRVDTSVEIGRRATIHLDPIGMWVAERVEITGNPEDKLAMHEMFEDFEDFADENDVGEFTQKTFERRFWRKNYRKVTKTKVGKRARNFDGRVRGAAGVKLRK